MYLYCIHRRSAVGIALTVEHRSDQWLPLWLHVWGTGSQTWWRENPLGNHQFVCFFLCFSFSLYSLVTIPKMHLEKKAFRPCAWVLESMRGDPASHPHALAPRHSYERKHIDYCSVQWLTPCKAVNNKFKSGGNSSSYFLLEHFFFLNKIECTSLTSFKWIKKKICKSLTSSNH